LNRRDLFRRLVGAAAAAGLSGATVAAHVIPGGDPAAALVTLSVPGKLAPARVRVIERAWTRIVEGTPWKHVRFVILEDGMRLEVHRP
jgi:hypothetical protein